MENMKKTYWILALAFAALSSFLQAQTTSYSDVVGYNVISVPKGSSLQGVNFVNQTEYVGTVSAVSSSTVTLSGLSVTANAWALTDGVPETEPANLPRYYLDVLSGSLAGYVFDIVSNSTTQVTLDSAPVGLNGSQVAVRRHITLGQLASQATGLTSNVDSITIFNNNGTQLDATWDGTNWVDLTNFVYGDDYVVYPGTGFVVNAANAFTVNSTGLVKTTPTVVEVFNGAVNIVTTMNPSVGSNVTLGQANFGEFLTKNADTLSTFTTSAGGQLQVEYDALSWTEDGGVSLWADLNTFTDATSNPIDASQPVVLSVGSPTTVKLPAPVSN